MNVDHPLMFKGYTEEKFIKTFQFSANYKHMTEPSRSEALKADWAEIEKSFPKKKARKQEGESR